MPDQNSIQFPIGFQQTNSVFDWRELAKYQKREEKKTEQVLGGMRLRQAQRRIWIMYLFIEKEIYILYGEGDN